MSRVEIVDYDRFRHNNPMIWVDDTQRQRYWKTPTLVPYKVCLVTVKRFTFEFHSVAQIRVCLDYYSREHHHSSKLPVYTENLGGDHTETQRWFDRLPQQLLNKHNRPAVIKALERAILEYSTIPGAETGVPTTRYDGTW